MLRCNAIAMFLALSVVWASGWLPAQTPSRASGQPRMTQGHPCTIWDQEDITRYKEQLKGSPELKAAFDQLQAWGDKRIARPLNVPAHTLEADGTWTFPAFPRGI